MGDFNDRNIDGGSDVIRGGRDIGELGEQTYEQNIAEDVYDTEEQGSSMAENKEGIDIKAELISWAKSIAVVIVVSFVFLRIFTNASIPSSSMEDTIMTHDRLFGYNFAYKLEDPKRGDIVIFRMPDEPHEIYIKRIIGIPGDEISFQKNGDIVEVLINGSVVEEPYVKEPMTEYEDVTKSFIVPKDSYFVMGDNRNNSYDSRYWNNSFVERDAIIAKAVFRYWPLNKMGGL